jgi:RNA polymerase sigma factor (sigma-70 family)
LSRNRDKLEDFQAELLQMAKHQRIPPADRPDLVQEVLTAMIASPWCQKRGFPDVIDKEMLRYAAGTLRRQRALLFRKRYVRQRAIERLGKESTAQPDLTDPLGEAERAEFYSQLVSWLRSELTEKERDVFILHYVHEMPLRRIAALTGMSNTNVHRHLGRLVVKMFDSFSTRSTRVGSKRSRMG